MRYSQINSNEVSIDRLWYAGKGMNERYDVAIDPELEGFELFDQAALPPMKAPYVTIQRDGLFSMNTSAYTALNEPEAVQLAYKESERTIAIIKADLRSPAHKPVRRQGKTSATWIFSGRLFTQRYGIDTTTARRYTAHPQNGKLFVDLREGGADATGVRARFKARSSDPAKSNGFTSTGSDLLLPRENLHQNPSSMSTQERLSLEQFRELSSVESAIENLVNSELPLDIRETLETLRRQLQANGNVQDRS
jgi:hypothetical protein